MKNPNIETGSIDGIKWIYEKDTKIPLVSFTICGFGGLKLANCGGLPYLTARMLLCGTPTKSADSIAASFERLGAFVESSAHYDTYTIEATTLTEHFDVIFPLVWECLNIPIFPNSEFKNLKNITRYQVQEIYEDPFNVAYKNLREVIFKKHPYKLSILGELSELNDITLSDTKKFYKKVYRKSNIIISIVGDIDKEKVLDILANNVKKYKLNNGRVTLKHGISQLNLSKTIVKKKKGIKLSAMIIGFRVCDTYSEDKFALSFIDSFLGGMSGILFKKVREEHGLAYEVSSFANFGLDTGALYIYARIDKKEESRVRKLIEKIIQDIKTKGLTESELLQFKNEISGTVLRQIQRNSAKSRDYALYYLYNLGLDYTQKYLDTIEKLTNDDIIKVANKYLNFDRAIISIVHPA